MPVGTKKAMEMNVFVRLAVAAFLIVSLIIAARTLMKYNDYREKMATLSLKKEAYEESIEKIRYELGQEMDDAYVIRVAKEKLNLCLPDEVVYYNGMN